MPLILLTCSPPPHCVLQDGYQISHQQPRKPIDTRSLGRLSCYRASVHTSGLQRLSTDYATACPALWTVDLPPRQSYAPIVYCRRPRVLTQGSGTSRRGLTTARVHAHPREAAGSRCSVRADLSVDLSHTLHVDRLSKRPLDCGSSACHDR